MKRSTAAALFAILLLAVIVRLLPLLQSLYWGSDFGEYVSLTRALAANGVLPASYRGWGIVYPEFPGLFVVNGALLLLGAPLGAAAALPIPILSAFVVLPVFLITARVSGDDLAALLAAAFLAVLMFHVFPTSHAIPGALGDLLLVGAFLEFLAVRRAPRLFPLLVLTGLAVVVTHHLTTYFLLLAASASLVLRAALDRNLALRAIRLEFAFLVVLAAAMLAYWAWGAPTLWAVIVAFTPFSGPALVAGTVLLVLAPPVVMAVRRRVRRPFLPRVRTSRAAIAATGIAFGTLVAFALLTTTAGVPGTTMRIAPASLLPYLPVLGIVALSAAGRRVMDLSREGATVTGWFLALCASLALGALAAPEILIPLRHAEYFAIVLAILAGVGARWITLGVSGRGRVAAVAVCVLLVAAGAATAYPPPAAEGHQEGIDARTVTVALWAGRNTDGLVAGDHRLSTVLFGIGGVDATWDWGGDFWHGTDRNATLAAMAAVPLPRGPERVSWVVIDADMRAGVMLSPSAPALPLTSAEMAKFESPPFQKVYDDGFSQVWYVNWGLAP